MYNGNPSYRRTMAVLVLTTVPDLERGEAIARALVEEGLAACASIGGPMTSIYRWQGATEQAIEHQMVIKTVREQVTAVQARVVALHPYQLPELVVLEVTGGSAEYLAWIRAETAGSGSAGTR
ncbi:MAG: divalent cation tolerance protein CutA [Luteitalea sp.]|nr:divalent cation tolerance protein CutA [Luteitalea sp.]